LVEGIIENVAPTDWEVLRVTVQVDDDPVHAPVQVVKVEVDDGVAVRVTEVPDATVREQADPQLIPVGDEVIVPVPDPAVETMRVLFESVVANDAPTVTALFKVTVQVVAVPEHAPVHPEKVEVDDVGPSVRVTTVPEA
jgi:hypothetical protein